jgi:Zn-dependent peptidase ImmA (M78 family)
MTNTAKTTLVARLFDRAEQLGLEEQLSELSGVGAARLQDIKEEVVNLSSSEYEALCRALVVDPTLMYRGREDESPAHATARFRTAFCHAKPKGLDLRVLLWAAESGRVLAALMRELDEPIPLSELRQTRALEPTSAKPWEEGYELGERARGEPAPEQGPLRDIESLLVDAGVHVIEASLSAAEVDAASLWEQGAPVIVLNASSPRMRHPGAWRATLAHELCHLLHDADDQALTTCVSWGAEGRGDYEEDVERRTRAFAPAFLAPRAWVRAWAEELPTKTREDAREFVRQLATYWGLSFEGAAWHAQSCDLISHQQARDLVALDRKPHVDYSRFKANLTLGQGHWGSRAVSSIQLAADEGHISQGRADELLSWS